VARAALLAFALLVPSASPAEEAEPRRPDPKELEIQVMRLKDTVASFRERAARKIGEWGSGARSAVPSLIPLLTDGEPSVRRAAAFALARMEKEAAPAEAALAAALPKEPDPGTRANLAWALGAAGTGQGGRAALAKAMKDPDVAVRVNAARALGDLAAPEAAALAALTAALKDAEWTMRANAAWAVGAPRERARPAVASLARLLADESQTVRAMAARALGRIAEDDDLCVPALLRALQEECDRLVPPGGGKTVPSKPPEDPTLLDRLAKEGGARRNMVWALGRFGSLKKEAKALLQSLQEKDPCPAVRGAAKTAIERADVTVLPSAMEEQPRDIAGDPKAPWRMAVSGGCLQVVFRHEK